MAEWSGINDALNHRLVSESPAKRITSEEEFIQKVNDVVRITYEVLQEQIDEKSPNPYKQRWWTKELSLLKKAQNRLSNKSFKLWHVRDHLIHTEYRLAANKFKEVMAETHNQDWTDWLEGASQQDLYLANKYIASESTDYSNTRIPSLRTHADGIPDIADNNDKKVRALAESFPPLPPTGVFICPTASSLPNSPERPPLLHEIKNTSSCSLSQPLQSPGPRQDS
jgi:hypothetical protein